MFTPTASQVAPGFGVTTGFRLSDSDGTAPVVTASATTVAATSINDARTLGGDHRIALVQGGSAPTTTAALTACDPDVGQSLTYTLTGTARGQVLVDGTALAVNGTFTQTQLPPVGSASGRMAVPTRVRASASRSAMVSSHPAPRRTWPAWP